LINGVEGLRAGGSTVDAASVIWFGAVSGLVCAAVGTYELGMSRRIGSQLLRNVGELLHMGSEDDVITGRVEAAMRVIRSELDIRSHSTHIAKVGCSHLVEVNIVVGPRFELQSVAGQDGLRQRIWSAVDRPIDAAWLTIDFTADPRWA
jgi:predicted Co/Zn/Cd cation transporter (cation efflux family)